MDKMLYVKNHIQYATIAGLQNFLKGNDIEYDRKWKKNDYVETALKIINENNVDEFIEMAGLKLTSSDVTEILDITPYQLKKLVDKGMLHVTDTYKRSSGYGYGNLYSAREVFECIGKVSKPKSRSRNEHIMDDMPDIMDYYPKAKPMHRKFVIHVGATNTGKTYDALQALKTAESGVYLAPLRLLAMEVCDRLNDEGCQCSLLTGEEENIIENADFESRTVEKVCLDKEYDIAVIDECQMLGDRDRGDSWTRAIMGVCAKIVHVITAPEGLSILEQLIIACKDEYEVKIHKRENPLIAENSYFSGVRNHDALIVFSRRAVLSLAADLEKEGISVSIIYGSLPYSVRISEAEKFRNGKTNVVISTDAIGMGLNLPIERIVFMQGEKFDGHERRKLTVSEFKQIAGRAGRRGMFDTGYVNALQGAISLKQIKRNLSEEATPIDKIIVGFFEELLQNKQTYGTLLREWAKKVKMPEPFVKKDVSRELALYSNLTYYHFDNIMAYKLCNIPFDEKDENLKLMWLQLINLMHNEMDICNAYPKIKTTTDLGELEIYYKKLDLFYSFCKSMNYNVDVQRIREDKEKISLEIIDLLKGEKSQFANRCRRCGNRISWNEKYAYCDKCYAKISSLRYCDEDF